MVPRRPRVYDSARESPGRGGPGARLHHAATPGCTEGPTDLMQHAHPGPATTRTPTPSPDAQTGPAPHGQVGEIFDSGKTFADLGVRNSVLKGLEAIGIKHPTSI